MTLADHLARQRNRDAAERTLMAWIRTCLSLISFGFGLDKIVAAINGRFGGGGSGHAEFSVRLIAMAFIVTRLLRAVRGLPARVQNLCCCQYSQKKKCCP